MTTRIRFLGIAGYEIVGPGGRILIDPFLTGNPVAPVGHEAIDPPDVILVSHPPIDHLGDTAAIAIRTGAAVVCGGDSRALLLERGVPAAQIRHTTWGLRIQIGSLLIRPTECHHWSSARLDNGTIIPGVPISFIVETEPGVRVYHSGDSALFSDMRLTAQLHQPTIGLMGCSQPYALLPDLYPGSGEVVTGEMDPDEAALAAEFLGLRIAVASHYLDTDEDDVHRFLERVPIHDTSGRRVAIALRPDETLVVDGASHRVDGPTVGAT